MIWLTSVPEAAIMAPLNQLMKANNNGLNLQFKVYKWVLTARRRQCGWDGSIKRGGLWTTESESKMVISWSLGWWGSSGPPGSRCTGPNTPNWRWSSPTPPATCWLWCSLHWGCEDTTSHHWLTSESGKEMASQYGAAEDGEPWTTASVQLSQSGPGSCWG